MKSDPQESSDRGVHMAYELANWTYDSNTNLASESSLDAPEGNAGHVTRNRPRKAADALLCT